MKIIVYHRGYGCESGCCGHAVRLQDDNGKEIEEAFEFTHPYDGDAKEFAKKLVTEKFGEEHVADLDWENCVVTNEC